MEPLYDDERLDYLLANEDMNIIQSPTVFSFSLDAVLLAHFTYVPIKKGNILDLCSGNGVIPLLLSRRTNASIIGIEIQERLVDMANRSVTLNELNQQISMIHGDLKEMKEHLGHSTFDVVTCNPPYFRTPEATEHNKNDFLTIARHEVYCTLEDVVKACKLHVRPGGKVSMVHRPGRLVDIIALFRQYNLEPKRLQFVYPKLGRDANMLLIEAIRDGKADLTILPPLYIYNDNNTYTKEAEDIIYG
ncbi:tRNA1(Val) (adenine(37)-N6)-methyltransferase [Virgibacillus doumboii]|uniref:tRNA1(Val) (adenine(37)-N6)-methyltransferase n=1 Tax=Virgibacillus doumboii TaxID=2697503 RepID=UPI0013DFDAF5|nr:tRNA1(Val) (adenine(37)-N6)-methyltransferase [Virgibacillus doumboii]